MLVNRTIDDQHGDSSSGSEPIYFPPDGWAVGNICNSCNIYPQGATHTGNGAPVDAAQTFKRTWHDSTSKTAAGYSNDQSTISVNFVGQAVYVFNLVANTVRETTTLTNLTFTLDNHLVGHYLHEPDPDPGAPEILYNVTVYANSSMPYGSHTLLISTTGPKASLVLFDYIIYTTHDSVAPPPTQENSPAPSTEPIHSISTSRTMTHQSMSTSSFSRSFAPSASSPSASSSFASSSSASSPKPPAFVGGLVGGIAGGLVAILLILLSAFLLRRYRHRLFRTPSRTNELSGGEAAAPGEDTAPDIRISRADTSSTSSLLRPTESPAPRASFLSEDFTAVAPYSDPKFANPYSPKGSHAPSSSRVRSRSPTVQPVSRTPSSANIDIDLDIGPEFTFVRSPGAPPSHAVDVPDPALSVTGTERSVRQAELAREIQELETMIRDLHYPGPGKSGRKAGRGAAGEAEQDEMSHRARVRALKREIARLRVELGREHRLVLEAAPRNTRPGKRVLTVIV